MPRGRTALALAVAAAVTVGLRWPYVVSRSVLGYDDGVYLASVAAMRAGGLPFREVYSSQGPAFLPLLWAGDLATGGVAWGARVVPLAAAVALAVLAHRLAALVAGPGHALAAALLVATSGVLALATWRVESDAVATAFAAGAVLLAARATGRAGAVGVAVLAALAVAVKSLLVLAPLAAVLWLLVRRRGWAIAGAVVAGAVVVVVALSVPWGLADVWEQAVDLHLRARGADQTIGDRVRLVGRVLRDDDRVLVGAAAVAAVAVVVRRRAPRRPAADRAEDVDVDVDVTVALWLWLALAGVTVLLHEPLFPQHLTVVVVPLALVVALLRPPIWPVAVAAAVLAAGQGSSTGWRVSSPESSPAEARAVALLRRVEPASSLVVSDEPGLVWLAGRVAPGTLVDPSFVRIGAGMLTAEEVRAALAGDDVCAVLFWSGRLDAVDGLGRTLDGYRSVLRDGDRELLLRDGCTLGPD